MTHKLLTVSSLLSFCLHFHFGRRECSYSRRLPTVPKLLSIIILAILMAYSIVLSMLLYRESRQCSRNSWRYLRAYVSNFLCFCFRLRDELHISVVQEDSLITY